MKIERPEGYKRYESRDHIGEIKDGDPGLSDKEIAEERAKTRSRENPKKLLPDGREVIDLGLVDFNNDIPTVNTGFDVPLSGAGERHTNSEQTLS